MADYGGTGFWSRNKTRAAQMRAGGDEELARRLFAETEAANRGGFGNTVRRIGSAAPKVAALAAAPAALSALGIGGAAAGAGGLAHEAAHVGAGAAGAGASGGAKSLGDLLNRGVGKILPGNLTLDDLLKAAGVAEGGYDMIRREQLRRRALNTAEDAYRDRGPLRASGVQGMMNPKRVDLSSLFADGNPYRPKGY